METDADGAISLDDTSSIGMDTPIREIVAALKSGRQAPVATDLVVEAAATASTPAGGAWVPIGERS